VGHAPRLLGRRGGAGVMDNKNKIAGHENKGNQSNIEKLAKYIGKKKNSEPVTCLLSTLSAEIFVEKVN
jgi:hypothetical protein